MAEQNTITIQFGAKGDKDVIEAIDKLDRSTKKLIDTQAKLTNTGKSRIKQMTASQRAMTNLNTKLKALDLNFKKVGISNKVLTKAYKGHKISIEKVRIATNKFLKEQKDVDVATRILGGTFAVLRSKLLLAGFAMSTLVRPIMRVVEEGANIESVKIAFDTLTGATENSEVALEKLQKATNNTMSEFDLFKQANNAMILGVTKNSDEMAEMFDIAQRLGRALGRDTASSVESLVTGIGRQSRLMLDNIGIIVKSEEAYEDYAKANNLLASSLTDAQKKQAFLEATMESARKKIKDVGDEIPTARDSLDAFTASVSNLGTTIGQNIPFTDTLLKFFTDIANKTNDAIKGEERIVELNDSLLAQTKQRDRLLSAIQSKFFSGSAKQELKIVEDRIKAITEEISILMEKDVVDKQEIETKKKLIEEEELKAQQEKINAEQAKFISEQRNIQNQQALEQIQALTQATKDLHTQELLATQAVEANISNTNLQVDVMKVLDTQQKFAVSNMMNLSNAMADAMINGQNMGDAVVSSLKAIATQLIAKAGVYALLSTFFAPAQLAGATGGFLNFLIAHTGGLVKDNKIQKFATGGQVQGRDNVPIMAQAGEFIIRKEIVDKVGVDNLAKLNNGETSTNNSTVNVNINGNVIGNESFVRDTLIPEINKTLRQGLA